jgi:hypothetical protein
MTINLGTSSSELSKKISASVAPVLGNPVLTGMLITVCVLVIIMFVIRSKNGVFKTMFWTMLVSVGILFLHDNCVAQAERDKYEAARREGGLVDYGKINKLVGGYTEPSFTRPDQQPIITPRLSVMDPVRTGPDNFRNPEMYESRSGNRSAENSGSGIQRIPGF